jgi:hypothetical protein
MLDVMGSNMLVIISGGYGPKNCEGNLAVKEGILSVVDEKNSSIRNIHAWTSAFMVYASAMLEKWPTKGFEFLKYIQTVRTAASRGCPGGWVLYVEQYRLRKTRFPASSWGVVDSELWMFCAVQTNPLLYNLQEILCF